MTPRSASPLWPRGPSSGGFPARDGLRTSWRRLFLWGLGWRETRVLWGWVTPVDSARLVFTLDSEGLQVFARFLGVVTNEIRGKSSHWSAGPGSVVIGPRRVGV